MSQGPSTKEILLDAVAETVGKEALEVIAPFRVEVPASAKAILAQNPVCITQLQAPAYLENSPTDILVGLNDQVPRWTPGSVVRWSVFRKGFATKEDARYAAKHMAIAAEVWNKANVGVTFEWVGLAKDATFALSHGGSLGSVLARAFFPNAKDLNNLFVYDFAFDQPYKDGMWKIFTHELGHVLGLRHEFALEEQHGEKRMGAVQIGPRNELSVMNYRAELPEMQPSDIASTREFYALTRDEHGNRPKIGLTPVIDYTPQ